MRDSELSAEDRASRRYVRAALTSVADVGSKGSALLLMLASVSLTLPYLGVERFGVWATLASLTGLLSFLDLGVGNALINRTAYSASGNDSVRLDELATAALSGLFLLGVACAAAIGAVALVLDWGRILNIIDPLHVEEARTAAVVFAMLFGLNMFANGNRSLFLGLQQGFVVHIATTVANISALVILWLATRYQAGVPQLLLATFGVQTAFSALLILVIAGKGLLGRVRLESGAEIVRGLLSIGALFFVLQIGTMVGWGADSLLIAYVMGPAAVAEFNVVQRLFLLVSQPLALVVAPLWAAYADARARSDEAFVWSTLRRSLVLVTALGLPVSLAVAFSAEWTIPLWTRGSIIVSSALVWVFAIWVLVQGLGGALGVFLNGMGVVKPQIMAVSAFVLLGIPAKWLALESIGLSGFVLVTMAVYLATHCTVYSMVHPIRRMAQVGFSGSQ